MSLKNVDDHVTPQKLVHYYLYIVMRRVTDIDAKAEIVEPSSNSALVSCVHFRTNAL